jgi:hypothetical protein
MAYIESFARLHCRFSGLARLVHIRRPTKEDAMKYVVKCSVPGGRREAARLMAELKAARRELQAARRTVQNQA